MRSRLLAGLRDRRGTHLALAAAVAVVTAGAVLVTGEDVDRALLIPLLVLAAGVVPSAGLALGADRRREAALLRLRGRHGPGWTRPLLAEPLVSVAAGGGAGVAAGLALAPGRWPVVAAVWAGAAVVVLAAMVVALRAPLPLLLQDRAGRAVPGLAATFVQVLVLVAAAVAVARSGADEADWVAFAGPTVVGLATGLVATWALVAGGRWLADRPGLASFLAGRRLGLRRAATGLPLVVGAGAVLGLALNTLLAAEDWEADTAAVTAGAPLVIPADGDAGAVLATTREADPEGRWLMAAVRVLGDDRPGSRRVFLDTARYQRVVGDGLADTPAADGSAAVADLAAAAAEWQPEPTATGGRLTATVATDGDRRALVEIAVETVGPDGSGLQTVFLEVPPGGATTASAELTRCDGGCQVVALEVAVGRPCPSVFWARPACRRPQLDVSRLDLGGLDLLDRAWALDEGDDRPPGELTATPTGLRIRPSAAGRSYLVVDRSPWAVPQLSTTNVDPEAATTAPTTSGLPRPGRVLGEYDVLPLVGTGGSLLDLPTALVRGANTVAAADAWVLAREDTPADVLAAVGTSETPEALAAPTVDAAGSDVARVLTVVALGGVALGVVGIVLPAARERRRRAHERAVLRLVGVAAGEQVRAGRLQVVLVAATAALATLAATVVTILAFGDAVPVLRPQPSQLPLDTGLRALPLLVAPGAVLLVVGVVGGWVERPPERASRPVVLREEVT